MDPWIPFVIWVAIIGLVAVLSKVFLTKIHSAITLGTLVAIVVLYFLRTLPTCPINIETNAWDAVMSIILIATALNLIIYTVLKIARDNKANKACYYCRYRDDLAPPSRGGESFSIPISPRSHEKDNL